MLYFQSVADSRAPLTGCILKQVKVLHENALFLPKISKNFLGGAYAPSPDLTLYPSALYSNFLDPPLFAVL